MQGRYKYALDKTHDLKKHIHETIILWSDIMLWLIIMNLRDEWSVYYINLIT